MQLTPTDAVCCPPPLFHCFGLVIGFLASFTHGSSIVFASPQFDAHKVLDAVVAERCTILLGVPTMFIAVLDANRAKQLRVGSLRAALAAGSPVPQALMRRLEREMGVRHTLIAYGMTETSPVTFMSSLDDSERLRISTVGTLLPHCGAKIVDKDGAVVPRGTRGEICTSGFALQLGYWENEDKTKEVMQADEHGTVWMYTGDEGEIDADGYCSITGRIKDTIIRGKHRAAAFFLTIRLVLTLSVQAARTSTRSRSKSASWRTRPSTRRALSACRTSATGKPWPASSARPTRRRGPTPTRWRRGCARPWAGTRRPSTSFGSATTGSGRTSPRRAAGSTRSTF